MIGPLFAPLAPSPVARPTGSREVVAPCGCRMRLTRSWVGELPRTVAMCDLKAAGKSREGQRYCAAGRGEWA